MAATCRQPRATRCSVASRPPSRLATSTKYSFFNVDPSIVVDSGFQVPVKPGVRFHNILTVSLGGNGVIAHVINDTGGVALGTATIRAYLASYGG